MSDMQIAAKLLHDAQTIAVLTGAGVSKESGVPTFRDMDDGIWNNVDPMTIATRQVLYSEPEKVWQWYRERHQLMSSVSPNAGHYALAKLQDYKPELYIITQNVDDLHEQAGSKNIIHLHGKYNRYKCGFNCQGEPTIVDFVLESESPNLPSCPYCGKWIRPDVVLFGEILQAENLQAAEHYSQNCELMLVIGTTGLVSPADNLPRLAKRNGAKIIEINPSYSMITRFTDIKFEAASGMILPQLLHELAQLGTSS